MQPLDDSNYRVGVHIRPGMEKFVSLATQRVLSSEHVAVHVRQVGGLRFRQGVGTEGGLIRFPPWAAAGHPCQLGGLGTPQAAEHLDGPLPANCHALAALRSPACPSGTLLHLGADLVGPPETWPLTGPRATVR